MSYFFERFNVTHQTNRKTWKRDSILQHALYTGTLLLQSKRKATAVQRKDHITKLGD